MELRHLRYFVAVAEECHFGRAAARLHIAQPPLSQQVKQLESELGLVLLERSTRRVELTPAGERYLERAREILGAVDAAGEEATRVASGEVGRVAIGFIGSATYALLPMLARALREQCPGIDFELHGEQLTPDLVGGLHDGHLDVAFLRPPVGDPDLAIRVLRRERLVAVLPERHRLADDDVVQLLDLASEPFICYPSGHRSAMYQTIIDACMRAGFRPRNIQEVAETSTLVVFVAAGLGVALVPESVQELQVSGAVFRPLDQDTEYVELALATRAGDRSPHLERVRECALQVVGAGAGPSAVQ